MPGLAPPSASWRLLARPRQLNGGGDSAGPSCAGYGQSGRSATAAVNSQARWRTIRPPEPSTSRQALRLGTGAALRADARNNAARMTSLQPGTQRGAADHRARAPHCADHPRRGGDRFAAGRGTSLRAGGVVIEHRSSNDSVAKPSSTRRPGLAPGDCADGSHTRSAVVPSSQAAPAKYGTSTGSAYCQIRS